MRALFLLFFRNSSYNDSLSYFLFDTFYGNILLFLFIIIFFIFLFIVLIDYLMKIRKWHKEEVKNKNYNLIIYFIKLLKSNKALILIVLMLFLPILLILMFGTVFNSIVIYFSIFIFISAIIALIFLSIKDIRK